MSLYPIDPSTILTTKLKHSKLIIPSVSTGNVPQLAIDLLIHSFDFTLVANLDHTYLFPFASPVDYVTIENNNNENVSTALQLYHSETLGISVIQQRSPILPSYLKNYINYLSAVVKQIGFDEVVVLDSNDYALRSGSGTGGDGDGVGSVEIYSDKIHHQFKRLNVSNNFDDSKLNFTRFSSSLIETLKETISDNISINGIVIFVYEGDNFHEAGLLTDKLLEFLEIERKSEYKTPVSWKGVYGSKPIPVGFDEGIYA